MEEWIERYVHCDEGPGNFVRQVNRNDDVFAHLPYARWKQDERSAIPALLHLLSPAGLRRNVRHENERSVLWLACARDRVLAAVVIDRPGDARFDLRVKRMNNPIESRILSTLVGEIPNVFLERVFTCVRIDIPNLLRDRSSFTYDLYTEDGDAALWLKLLALVRQCVNRRSRPVHGLVFPSVLAAVRIGRTLVMVRKLSAPETDIEGELVVHVCARYFQ